MIGGYEMVAGIEVHVQLATTTKMFCGCSTAFGRPPNTQVCPVCLGYPGVLPVVNRRATDLALRAALALECSVAATTKFDRKNYFYPDLPKSYQISQYDLPLATEGRLAIETGKGAKTIGIIRVHMEEDAGKLLHHGERDVSHVDMNRAGVPLIEIVGKPEIASPEEAHAYLTALKAVLRYAGISNCDMEKGELRCDLNVSVRLAGESRLGDRVEIKNLNSFRHAARALEYESRRQADLLASGGAIRQETRLFDPEKGTTEIMRVKEDAQDYRYFPEPDIPPLTFGADRIAEARRDLPELPQARMDRFMGAFGLARGDAAVLTADRPLADYYESCVKAGGDPRAAGKWIVNDVLRLTNERGELPEASKLTPEHLVELISLVGRGEITNTAAKEILGETLASGRRPSAIVDERGLRQVSDAGALEGVVRQVVDANPRAVADYRAGKSTAVTFFIGQVMRATKGKANPAMTTDLIRKMLDG